MESGMISRVWLRNKEIVFTEIDMGEVEWS
jgi:hypothetical protein